MMNNLFKGVIVIAAFVGLQANGALASNAPQTGLMQYAQDPAISEVSPQETIEVAGWRGRRNRAIAAGVVAGIATGIIINEATRSSRRRVRYSYPGRRTCRKWAHRCDYGSARSCRKFDRRCR